VSCAVQSTDRGQKAKMRDCGKRSTVVAKRGGGSPGKARKDARETVPRRPAARIGGQKLQMAAVPGLAPGGGRIAGHPENRVESDTVPVDWWTGAR